MLYQACVCDPLSGAIGSIRSDMRYAGDQNFVGRPIAGYLAPVCYLANPPVKALVEVHQGLLGQGYGLVLFDRYRPERATIDFVQWALTREDA
jgi:zinc D-Ala-D-Ala dipeptidase